MRKSEIEVCILRVGGTNCDEETKRSFNDLGVKADIVHTNRLVKEKKLLNYDILVFPGGFSYGDYVRAGAIWGKEIVAKIGPDLRRFVEEGRPVLGICNGFQVLVESGLLPGFDDISTHPKATLASNISMKYECRWVYVKHVNSGGCVFTNKISKGKRVFMAVAHAEGRFLFSGSTEDDDLRKLYDNDQLVFRYCSEEGEYANGEYPINPNGAFHDIAGVCNPEGTVLGLMPHPERSYYGWQLPNWTMKTNVPEYADGRLIFESVVEYLCNRRRT